ncbi:MAG: NAD(P)H-binding protein [Burkholderiales bacterium]|nr:NAD(P)H-binding protein [Burkholderiales bacterium]
MGKTVFVTGGTGYIGRPLVETLVARKHAVVALARAGSEDRVAAGATAVIGDALDAASFAYSIPRAATVVHLVGTPHPNPSKTAEFERVDLASIQATATAAMNTGAAHIVYVSVARPAPLMRSYIAARERGEAAVLATGIPATFVRPWYVLGPGHYWPVALQPLYALARLFPPTREQAIRLGLVKLDEIVAALVSAVETPPGEGPRIFDVPAIARSRL